MLIPGYYTGHAIALRPAAAVPDAELLDRLGLSAYRLVAGLPRWPALRSRPDGPPTDAERAALAVDRGMPGVMVKPGLLTDVELAALEIGPKAVVAVTGDWKVLADDLLYTLWNRRETRPALAALSAAVEVLTVFRGDCHDTFGFAYYRGGRLVRAYLAESLPDAPDDVFEDVGEPLAGELDAGDEGRVARVTAALGLRTETSGTPVRVYRPPADGA